MKIELFHIGGFSVHGYGFMIGIGFLLALVIGCFRAKRLGLKDESVIDIAILAGICGFAGAKVLYVIISFKDFIKSPMNVLGSSGFVVYGGIIAGVLAAAIYCKIKKLSFLQYFDLVMPEVAVAQGFGRLGCFLAGCCYGRPTDAWFGVTFPADSMAPSGIALIPTQLFSAAGDFVIAAVLLAVAGYMHKSGRQYFDGSIGCLYLVLYGVGRFVIEFFRNDYRGAVGFLSTSQFISVFIVALGITLAIHLDKAKKRSSKF
jgi:phosphatidylglycerol:prolipoprotein diacylglycerol transferase